MHIIEITVKKFLQRTFHATNTDENALAEILLFFKNTMSNNYKTDEKQLRNIITTHTQPSRADKKIKFIIYYKNKKLSNLLIKNNSHSETNNIAKQHHVVYQYTCTRDGCNATQKYIGYTTCTLQDRFRMHTQQSSSIKKHLQQHHSIQKVTTAELLKDVTIIQNASSKRDLIITEALLIKNRRPTINMQSEFNDKLLKIFIH